MDKYKKIKTVQLIVFALFIGLLAMFAYVNMDLKSISLSIIFSILTLVFSLLLLKTYRMKKSIQLELGLIKIYGRKRRFNYISIMNISLGLLFVIFGLISLPETTKLVFMLTLGIGWIISGFGNKAQHYIEIGNKYITKLKADSIRLDKVIGVEYMNDRLIVKKQNKKMEIFYNEFAPEEKESFIEEIKNRIKIENLA